MSYFPAAKLSAQVAASLGVSKILAGVIKNNVAVVTTYEKIVVNAGGLVLSGMLVEQSSNYIERVANDLAEWLEKRKSETDK
jgi:ribosomal protein L11 methylase PrmA